MRGKQHNFQMTSKGSKSQVEMLKKYCMAPETLGLKIGAAVMFVKNNFAAGYVNGTLGTVLACEYGTATVQTAEGKQIVVRPERWVIEQEGTVQAEIAQLPLRLAWAITVHKSQGMTLDSVEVDLSKSFAPGMGYVALSRVRSLTGLYLRGMNQRALLVDDRIQEHDRIFVQQSRSFE
jgi:ATP-dependent exoDNAse (exonuclease V) alpha subunit